MIADNSMEPNLDEVRSHCSDSILTQKLSENSQSTVPTRSNYAMATVKEVLTLSQSASSVVPVPFLKEAINVALKIMQLCDVR